METIKYKIPRDLKIIPRPSGTKKSNSMEVHKYSDEAASSEAKIQSRRGEREYLSNTATYKRTFP